MNAQLKLQKAEYGFNPKETGGLVRNLNGGLSEREWEVMLAITRGEKSGAIAKRLGLSPKTISEFRARIFRKTGIKSNVELALHAFRQGLIS